MDNILKYKSIIILIVFMFGCSSTPKAVKHAQQESKIAYEMQKPVVVRTSKKDDRPDWVKKSSYSDDENIYFVGAFLNGADYPFTVRCANAEAIKVACQALSQFIRAEFSGYIQGDNQAGESLDRYMNDGIAAFTRALHVQGLRQTDIYYEETFSPAVMSPGHNVWVKIEMSKVDYMRAKNEALKTLRDRFKEEGDLEARKRAEELLDELKKEAI